MTGLDVLGALEAATLSEGGVRFVDPEAVVARAYGAPEYLRATVVDAEAAPYLRGHVVSSHGRERWGNAAAGEYEAMATAEEMLGEDVFGHGGGGGHHHHGGGWGGPWGWGYTGPVYAYPWLEIDDMPAVAQPGVDVDALAEAVARRLKGETVVGDAVEEDAGAIGDRAKQMSMLGNVTVRIGQSLLKGGYAAVDAAEKYGTTDRLIRRSNIRGHLDWHRDALKTASSSDAPYASADDLKKWVLEAYIEANVAKEGRAYLDRAWKDMWSEIVGEVADYARRIGNVAAAPFLAVESVFSLPTWAKWAGGATVVGLLGWGIFKILQAAAPGVSGAVARRYLP